MNFIANKRCPFYSLDALINNEISDYEALLEAFKIQNNFITQKKAMRYRLDQQLELFNSLNIQNACDERVERSSRKLEQLKAEFSEIDVLSNLILVVMAYYEMERFEIEKYKLYWEKNIRILKRANHKPKRNLRIL